MATEHVVYEIHTEPLPEELLVKAKKGGRKSKHNFGALEVGHWYVHPYGDKDPEAIVKSLRTAVVVYNNSRKNQNLPKQKIKVIPSSERGGAVVWRQPDPVMKVSEPESEALFANGAEEQGE